MKIFVNGERVPLELITEEFTRLSKLPAWRKTVPGFAVQRLNEAAELCAIDRILLKQESEKDKSPVDPLHIEREFRRASGSAACRTAMNEQWLRQTVERQLRFRRAFVALRGDIADPSHDAILQVFEQHRGFFRKPEEVHAADIVCHVDEVHPEPAARAGIEAALAELEAGCSFHEVAERQSDCKGKGGDLGFVPRGEMVPEFDDAVFALTIGERTGIFRSPFGFHIAEVRGKRAARMLEFPEAEPQIKQALLAAAEQAAMSKAFAALRERANIARVEDRKQTD